MNRPTVDPEDSSSGPAEPDYAAGDVIGNRYVVKHYAPGGINDVYLCRPILSGADVALKFPKPGSSANQERVFRTEVGNWAALRAHPHVVECLAVERHGGHTCLVLQWVGAPGPPRDVLEFVDSFEHSDPLERQRTAVRLARQICDGLAHIHGHGIVHGDLKPGNILVDENGRAKISDLGMSQAGSGFRGTPPYAAPELFQGAGVSVGSDIYALGCVIYELATGERSFETREGLPKKLGRLIGDCLREDPGARPVSALKVRERLYRIFPEDDDLALPVVEHDDGSTRDQHIRVSRHAGVTAAGGRRKEAIDELTIALRKAVGNWDMIAWKSLSDRPGSHLAWMLMRRGLIRATTEEWPSALGDFLRAIRIEPRLAVAHANLGTVYRRLAMPVLALAAYDRAVELDPEDPRFLLKRAALFSEQGWIQAAYQDCLQAIALAPDDAAACASMADVLFALGREEEVSRYREKSLELEGARRVDDWLDVIRLPDKADPDGHFQAYQKEYRPAIEAYSRRLAAHPENIDLLHHRGDCLLEAGDAAEALKDFGAFLEASATTHPYRSKARAGRRKALEILATPESGEPEFPAPKSLAYIRRRIGVARNSVSLTNWLPIPASQRLRLLEMIHSGEPRRKLDAQHLMWQAYHEEYEKRWSSYRELLPESSPPQTAELFTEAEILGDIALKNGLGIPVLLAEMELSPHPVVGLAFSTGKHPSLLWVSESVFGIWEVVPGYETRRLFAPQESADLASACFYGEDGIAVGLSSGHVLFLDANMEVDEAMEFPQSEEVALHRAEDGTAAAFCGETLYRLTAEVGDELEFSEGAPLAFDGERLIRAEGEDALCLITLGRLDGNIILRAEDSLDRGFAAAAMSADGSVVVAVCDSYLHLWCAHELGSHTYEPIVPQPWSRSVAVSPDGAFVAVGTADGSVVIYRLSEVTA